MSRTQSRPLATGRVTISVLGLLAMVATVLLASGSPATGVSATPPEEVRFTAVDVDRVGLAWRPPSSGSDGISYEIRRNGEVVVTTDETSWVDLSVETDRHYAYEVVAVDAGRSTATPSEPVELVVPRGPSGARSMEFGVYAKRRNGESSIEAIRNLESAAGGEIDVVRDFAVWDAQWPWSVHHWVRGQGKRLMISIGPQRQNGSIVRYAAIASAQPGSNLHGEIVRWARAVRDWNQPIYMIFAHEADVPRFWDGAGSRNEFKAAWRKIVSIFDQHGADNAEWIWTLSNNAYDQGEAHLWYPGDAYVDHLGADFYNWAGCANSNGSWNHAWIPLGQRIEPLRQFGLQHPSKGLWIPEMGSHEDWSRPGRKAGWMAEARALFKQPGYEQFEGMMWFHSAHDVGGTTCQWWADSSQSALRAFGDFLADPFYDSSTVTCSGLVPTVAGTVGTSGPDVIIAGPANDVIVGRGGDDIICAGGGHDQILGGGGNDTIRGGAGNDVINGHPGNDDIAGSTGADTIFGGAGNDVVTGGGGADDGLYGGPGADEIHGGAGRDAIWGGTGNDRIRGDDAPDRIYGGRGADTLWGGAGDDIVVSGGYGTDTVYGGAGNDRLLGDGGSGDVLRGGAGNDNLNGGAGGDELWGDQGNDRCSGGADGTARDSVHGCETRFMIP